MDRSPLRRSCVAAALSVLLLLSSTPPAQGSTSGEDAPRSHVGSLGPGRGEAIVQPQATPTPPSKPAPTPIDNIALSVKAGSEGTIASADGKISVTLPKQAVAEDLRLEFKRYAAPGGRSGMLSLFTLDAYATARADAKVTTFPANVAIAYRYTEADLAGLDPRSLNLFYLDEAKKAWVLVPSQHDAQGKTLTSAVGHFSTFSQQAQPLDSGPGQVMAFTNDLHSGTAVARYPLDLPPGPGGFKPKLELVYNSGVADETKNQRDVASWVGMGWSLHLGRITHPENSNTYTLEMPDGSYELLYERTDANTGAKYWRTRADAFWKVKSNPLGGIADVTWEGWSPEGTKYTFGGTGDSRQCSANCFYGANTYWRWDVSSIQDVHDNAIYVAYWQDPRNEGDYHRASYPQDVWYDGPSGSGHINIHFTMSAGSTNTYDGDIRPDNPYTYNVGPCRSDAPKYMETRRLDSVQVRIDGTLLREYDFTYDITNRYLTHEYVCSNGTDYVPYAGTLSLVAITERRADGSSLPSMTFGYANQEVYFYNGGLVYVGNPGNPAILAQHRLTTVNNGYGGITSYNYAESPQTRPWNLWSREVVAQKSVSPGVGLTQSYSYAYTGAPKYYQDPTQEDPQQRIWYASYRGFGVVSETDASGAYSDHWYYTTGTVNGKDAEKLTGKEYQTEWRTSANTLLRSASYDWNPTTTTPSTNYFVHLDTTTETTIGRTKQTRYVYDTTYGNVTTEYRDGDTSGSSDDSVVTREFHPNTAAWIINKPALERVSASGATKAESFFYYDGAASYTSPPSGGNLTRVQQATTPGTYVNRYYTYDARGNKTSETDHYGNVTSYTYDSRGIFLTGKTFPLVPGQSQPMTESYTWDPAGVPLSETDVNGQTTTYQYDSFKRLVKVFKPGDSEASPTIQHQYLSWGTVGQQHIKTLTKVADGDFLWRSQYFDGLGRVVQVQARGEAGRTIIESTRSYDSRGLVDKEYVAQDRDSATVNGYKAPEASWKYTSSVYDGLGRVTSTTKPDGTVVGHGYTDWTDLTSNGVGSSQDHWNRYTYDAFNRLAQVEELDNSQVVYSTTMYTYDALGNLTQVQDAASPPHFTTLTYDMLSRKTSMTDADMGAWSYVHDSNGNLTSQTDAKSQTITFTYDALNRPITRAGSGLSVAYAYDDTSYGNVGKGRRTGMSAGAGSTSYVYDTRGRLTNEKKTIDSNTFTTAYAYDSADRLTQVTYPGDETATTAYNLRGLPQSLTSSLSGSLASGALYNALGLPTQVDLGNDLSTTYGYWNLGAAADKYTNGTESYGRLWEVKTAKPGFSPVQDLQHTWDFTGNLTQRQDVLPVPPNTENFTYDFLDRLTSASGAYSEAYAYDPLGNITCKGAPPCTTPNYTYGAKPHAVIQVGTTGYDYDSNGNMTVRGAQTLAWDAENRPTSVSQGGSTQASFAYDGDGQRVKKTEAGQTTLYVNKYYEQRLPLGLVGRWNLDEGSGTVAGDSSGMGNNGPVSGPTWTAGKSGSGLQFNGAGYVSGGSASSLNITGALTVEYWMKPTTLQETGGVNKYDLNNQRSWTVYPRNDGAVVFRVSSDGTANTLVDAATSANAYSSGAWTHVVATYTPSTSMKIYVNGVESASLTTGVPASLYAAPTIPVYMGSYGQANGVPQTMFNGLLDEVRIYSRALSAAEVASRYLDTSGGPVAEWRLEEGTGTVAHDTSGQGNNGTLQNGPAWTAGKYGNALQLDGQDDNVHLGSPSALSFGTGDFSLEAWVKPGTQPGARGTVLGKGERWRIDVEAPSCIDADFSVTMPGGSTVQRPFWACGTPVFDGNWHHIVVVYDRDGNGTIYVDGAVASGANNNISLADLAAGSVDNAWQVRMGQRTLNEAGTATQWPFNGLLDEVRIYNRALSATEVQARYASAPEDNDTLHYYLGGKEVAFKRGGTLYFPLQDHLGSSAVITNSSGALVESMAYYPYGGTRTGSIATTEEKFTGQRLDSTGLYYYNARYYDPGIGRFISADTFVQQSGGFALVSSPLTVNLARSVGAPYPDLSLTAPASPQALNRYSYVFDNPLKYTDPHGWWTVELQWVVFSVCWGVACGSVSVGVAIDDKGGIMVTASAGTGPGYGVGVSSGIKLTFTNADTVENLKGKSRSTGGDVNLTTFLGLPVGGGTEWVQGLDKNGQVTYNGVSFTAGVGVASPDVYQITESTIGLLLADPQKVEEMARTVLATANNGTSGDGGSDVSNMCIADDCLY